MSSTLIGRYRAFCLRLSGTAIGEPISGRLTMSRRPIRYVPAAIGCRLWSVGISTIYGCLWLFSTVDMSIGKSRKEGVVGREKSSADEWPDGLLCAVNGSTL